MAKIELKAPVVDEIKKYAADATSAVLVDYRGLTVNRILFFVRSFVKPVLYTRYTRIQCFILLLKERFCSA